jgi:hypothetical protein
MISKKKKLFLLSVFIFFSAFSAVYADGDQDAVRTKAIMAALPNLESKSIMMKNGQGRIDVDQSQKNSYFIFTANPNDPHGETVLIPLATIRYDKFNYQTDEWWDAHSDEIAAARAKGTQAPRQDLDEVDAWLKANGISTNPDVITVKIGGSVPTASREKLQDFLLRYYLSRNEGKETVTLFRGGEKPGELDQWKAGQYPKGVRYWTADATYAWRYARKNTGFIPDLVKGNAPLFKFEIPKSEFTDWVHRGKIVLGMELTKAAHRLFESRGKFVDHLADGDYYIGDGVYGTETEMRPKREVRGVIAKYFKGAVSVEELADERRQQIERGTTRLVRQYPTESASLAEIRIRRLEAIQTEESLLKAIRDGYSGEEIQRLKTAYSQVKSEIGNVDGTSVRQVADEYVSANPCGRLGAIAP